MSDYGKIFVISAPSGTGKTTIAKKIKELSKDIEVITTCTTRKPRPGETDGNDYRFITLMKFKEMIEKGEFAEWALVYDNYYGTPKKDIISAINKGKKALLIIDTQGGRSIKSIFSEAVLIGILPPSVEEQERRIRKRSGLSEAEIKKRLESAKEERKVILSEYDHRFINKNLEKTIKKIATVIERSG
ncbi:MAG: guanylate kinase [Candidatus Omnitrophica bacterium]|nr:guanylate kinase [Candidatus Omnitrophota bacterium]MCM8776943.1 guanylate kinase [Candidatus Omnitrophota bacterium]